MLAELLAFFSMAPSKQGSMTFFRMITPSSLAKFMKIPMERGQPSTYSKLMNTLMTSLLALSSELHPRGV